MADEDEIGNDHTQPPHSDAYTVIKGSARPVDPYEDEIDAEMRELMQEGRLVYA